MLRALAASDLNTLSVLLVFQSAILRKPGVYSGINVNGHDHPILAMPGLCTVKPQRGSIVDGDLEFGSRFLTLNVVFGLIASDG